MRVRVSVRVCYLMATICCHMRYSLVITVISADDSERSSFGDGSQNKNKTKTGNKKTKHAAVHQRITVWQRAVVLTERPVFVVMDNEHFLQDR